MINQEIGLTELWLPIKDLDGYEVSNMGNLRSIDRIIFDKNGRPKKLKGMLLEVVFNKGTGYINCNFHLRGKSMTKSVHRLVAEAFLGFSNLDVDHLDDDRTNNKLSNLSYLTKSDNNLKSSKRKKKSSKYHYVYFKKRANKWVALEPITNKQIGYYFSEEEANNARLNHIKIKVA